MQKPFSPLMVTSCAVALLLGVAALSLPVRAEEKTAPVAPVSASKEEKAKDKDKDYIILDVDGDKVKYSEVLTIWKSLFPQGQAPEFSRFDEKVRQNVLRGVVSEQALYKKAKAAGLEESPKIKDMLARLERKFITQEYLEQQASAKVSDGDVRKEYDRRAKEKKGKTEIHARHILVGTEDEAKALKKQLDDGADFEKLAQEKSIDRASARRGGDLGFFDESEMVPAFTKAAFALDKGEVSAPVKSEFGWHIIKVEDKRDAQMPPYGDVDDTIREELKAEALKKYIQDVLDATPVKYYDPEGKELQLTKTPDTSSKKTP